MLFGAGSFAAGFLAVFFFFFVAAYALSKLLTAGRMNGVADLSERCRPKCRRMWVAPIDGVFKRH
jgi:hypothetical protein